MKNNIFAYTIGLIFLSLILLMIAIDGKRTDIHHLVFNRTPASNHEPVVGDGKLWNTEFNYKFTAPEPDGFRLDEYKSTHLGDLPILSYIGDGENTVTVYSNSLPDKNIFPHKLRWGAKL